MKQLHFTTTAFKESRECRVQFLQLARNGYQPFCHEFFSEKMRLLNKQVQKDLQIWAMLAASVKEQEVGKLGRTQECGKQNKKDLFKCYCCV